MAIFFITVTTNNYKKHGRRKNAINRAGMFSLQEHPKGDKLRKEI